MSQGNFFSKLQVAAFSQRALERIFVLGTILNKQRLGHQGHRVERIKERFNLKENENEVKIENV